MTNTDNRTLYLLQDQRKGYNQETGRTRDTFESIIFFKQQTKQKDQFKEAGDKRRISNAVMMRARQQGTRAANQRNEMKKNREEEKKKINDRQTDRQTEFNV
jgi:hypothetical protein